MWVSIWKHSRIGVPWSHWCPYGNTLYWGPMGAQVPGVPVWEYPLLGSHRCPCPVGSHMGTPPMGIPWVPIREHPLLGSQGCLQPPAPRSHGCRARPAPPQPSPSGLERSQLLFVGSHFPSLPFSARFYYIYLCVCLSGRRSYFNFFRILNKRSGGGGCGGRPCIPHPLRSERGLIGDNDLDGADRWKTSEPPQGWRGLAASLRWDAAAGAEPPPKKKKSTPPHPGGFGKPRAAVGGSGGAVGAGRGWVWAPRGLGRLRSGFGSGTRPDALGARWHWPTHGEQRFGGKNP